MEKRANTRFAPTFARLYYRITTHRADRRGEPRVRPVGGKFCILGQPQIT